MDKLDPALIARVAARYAAEGRFARGFVAGKLRRDPAGPAILRAAGVEGFGEVVDLGCGRGQLAVALLLAGAASAVTGIETAPVQAAQAARAGAGLAFRVIRRDLAAEPVVPAADTVLIVDVLYQLPTAAQAALLVAAAAAARRRVLIRALDPEAGARAALTIGWERLSRRLSPHAGAVVNPRPSAEAVAILRAAGFAVTVAPCRNGTPFANVLITACRPGVPSPPAASECCPGAGPGTRCNPPAR